MRNKLFGITAAALTLSFFLFSGLLAEENGRIKELYKEAQEIEKTQDYAAVSEKIKEILAIDPGYLNARAFLGYCYWKLGDNQKAEEELNKAFAEDPSHYLTRRNLGILRFAQRRYREAYELLEKLPEEGCKEAFIYNLLGVSAEDNYIKGIGARSYFFEKTVSNYKKAIELDPKFVNPQYHLAFFYDRQAKWPLHGLREYRKALKLDPNHVDAPAAENNAGICLDIIVNDYFEFDSKPYKSKEEGEAGSAINEGNLLYENRKYREAEQKYRDALELAPGSPAANINLANALMRQKKIYEARKYLRKALEIDPDNKQAKNNMETCDVYDEEVVNYLIENTKYYTEKMGPKPMDSEETWAAFDAALSFSGKLIKSDPSDPRVNLVYGDFKKMRGEKEEAEKFYKQALQINPDFKEAKDRLAGLE